MWVELESQLFSVVSLGVEQLLSKFPVFLDCLFPGPLMRETRLLGGAFLYAPIIVSRLLALFVSSLRYMKGGKKRPQEFITAPFLECQGP